MMLRSYIFRRVTIVGVGLMGGSLGKAIKKNKLAKEVVGLSQKQSSLVQAINSNAIDIALTDFKQAIRNADLIVLATPVESIIKLLPSINAHVKRGAIITDLGSAKAEIVEAAQKSLSTPNLFIGSHPLTGSDKRGVDNARDDLFTDATVVMTPTASTSEVAKKKVKHLWTRLGAKVKSITPEEHDEILSYVSHLPHILAYNLMETVPDKYLEYAASGLKDSTRIAGSSPQIWNDICMSNAKHVIKAIDETVQHLATIRKTIIARDRKVLTDHFTRAKNKRDKLSS